MRGLLSMRKTKNNKIKLSNTEYVCLKEALRRHLLFELDKPLHEKWTGLGTRTDYKYAIKSNLMQPISYYPRYCPMWLKLTNKGIDIIRYWILRGYTKVNEWEVFNYNNQVPPKEIPLSELPNINKEE